MNVLLKCLEKECNVIFFTLFFFENVLALMNCVLLLGIFVQKDLATPIKCTVESWYKDHLWDAAKVVFTAEWSLH